MFGYKKPQFEIRSIKTRRLKGMPKGKVVTLLTSPGSIKALKYAGIAVITIALMIGVYFQDQADKITHHQVQALKKIHKLLLLIDVTREITSFL